MQKRWFAHTALLLGALFMAALPGTADLNVWKAWADGLAEAGFITGYNEGVGHILQPPLGMALLCASHWISPWMGLPEFVWPGFGWTGYAITLWAFLAAGAFVVFRITRSAGWTAAFQLAFALNIAYGYFDIFGIPVFLLALHALAERRLAWGLFLGLVAALIKWQFLVFAPFVGVYVIRCAVGQDAIGPRAMLRAMAPSVGLVAIVLALLGPGTWLSLQRGMAHDTLSGYALNFGWILTWAMHLRWPESYGPLEEGLIGVIRTQDTRVLGLVRVLFGATFLLALWRQWRLPNTAENLLRTMLAGYLAYFLFNKGAHENHLVPAIAVAGYLAWRSRGWLPVAVLLAVAANVNMLAFYTLTGVDRGMGRVALGVDWSLPLAGFFVLVLGVAYMRLLWLGWRAPDRSANRSRSRQPS